MEQKSKAQTNEDKEREVLLLLQMADDASRAFQLPLGESLTGFSPTLDLSGIADPDLAYKLYYDSRRIFVTCLPKGRDYKPVRQLIYDEFNLFLNRGKAIKANGLRGSDGRMALPRPVMEEAFRVLHAWGQTSMLNPSQLYNSLRELNLAHGYHVS